MRRLAEARARGRVLLRVTIVAPLLLACGCGLVERAALRRAMRRVGEDHSALGSEVAAGQTEGAIVAASSLLHALAAPEITEYGPYRFDPAYQRSLHDALETIYAFAEPPLTAETQHERFADISSRCDTCHARYRY